MSDDLHADIKAKLLAHGVDLTVKDEKTWANYKASTKLPHDQRPTVCFSGITIKHRYELKEIAERNGFRVVKAVANSLSILVVGPTFGPAKATKAKQNNIGIISEPEFLELILHLSEP